MTTENNITVLMSVSKEWVEQNRDKYFFSVERDSYDSVDIRISTKISVEDFLKNEEVFYKQPERASDEEFWKVIEGCDWAKDFDFKRVKKFLISKYRDDVDGLDKFREAYTKKRGKLGKVARNLKLGLGDDSYGDLLAHIIGLGQDEFDKCIDNPKLIEIRARKNAFVESFAYSIPYASDFKCMELSYYKEQAQRIIDDLEGLDCKAAKDTIKLCGLLLEGDIEGFLRYEEGLRDNATVLRSDCSLGWLIENTISDLRLYGEFIR
jgi:hypothetical protein